MSQLNTTIPKPKRAVPTGILEQPITKVEQFARLFKVVDNGCWEWQGARVKYGYGKFNIAGRTRSAHRIMWELVGNPVDYDKELNHKCVNPPCVNPAHLEQVTSEANQFYKRKEVCKRGHLRANNDVEYNNGHGGVSRRCKACASIRMKDFNNRNPGYHQAYYYKRTTTTLV